MLGSLWFNSFSSGAGASADYELISTTVLGSTTATVAFTGIDTTAAAYKHLQLRITARTNRSPDQDDYMYMTINGVAGTSYSYHLLNGNGSSVTSNGFASQPAMRIGNATLPGSTATANAYGGFIIDLLDHSSTNKNKTIRSLSGVASSLNQLSLASGAFHSTAAVTDIAFYGSSGSLVSGSRFSLYGLKG